MTISNSMVSNLKAVVVIHNRFPTQNKKEWGRISPRSPHFSAVFKNFCLFSSLIKTLTPISSPKSGFLDRLKWAGTKPAHFLLTLVNILFNLFDHLTTILKVLGSFRGQISIFLLSSKIIIPEKGYFSGIFWLRRLDLNQRPSGYENQKIISLCIKSTNYSPKTVFSFTENTVYFIIFRVISLR